MPLPTTPLNEIERAEEARLLGDLPSKSHLLWKLVTDHWNRELQWRDKTAIHSAWFDYRGLHPAVRAQFFYREYIDSAVAMAIELYGPMGRTYAPFKPAFNSLYYQKAQKISLVIGRMHLVDEMGLPYRYFFEHAFWHWMQERAYAHSWRGKLAGTRSYDLLPPLRLLLDGECVVAVLKSFEHACRTKMIMPVAETYKGSNWTATNMQQAYAKWVTNNIRLRPQTDHVHILRSLVNDRDLFAIEAVEKHFGTTMMKAIAA